MADTYSPADLETCYANPHTAASVVYEHRMLTQTGDVLLGLQYEYESFHKEWDKEQRNAADLEVRAYLESFLVHYRNLQDFLSPRHENEKKLHKNDVTAGPFLGKPRAFRMPDVSTEHRDSIDKFLAHISTARGDGLKRWSVGEMMADLDDSFHRFVGDISDDEVKEWFVRPVPSEKDGRLIIEDTYSS